MLTGDFIMAVKIGRNVFYTTSEACRLAGTNRNTFLRWVREGRFPDVPSRDRNGWRLFLREDITRLRDCVNEVQRVPV
jgi:excisionase family DNA binding protein